MRDRSEGATIRRLLAFVAAEVAVATCLAVVGLGAGASPANRAEHAAHRRLVSELRLTDLALWSGPSYTRHPSQTDLFAPFADHPGAFEHFPAGSLVPHPPPRAPRPAGDATPGKDDGTTP